MKSKIDVPEGHEIRGFRFRAYPTADQVAAIRDIQSRELLVWNSEVAQSEQAYRAWRAGRLRTLGLAWPARPADDAGETVWTEHKSKCVEVGAQIGKPPKTIYRNLRDRCAHYGVRHDYQLFARVLDWAGLVALPAVYGQFIGKCLMSKGRKRFRRKPEEMPIGVRTGRVITFGPCGARGKNANWYEASIHLPGVPDVIRCRFGGARRPTGRVLEGASLSYEAGRWYASGKSVEPITPEYEAEAGTAVGIDVGLRDMYAMVHSDGSTTRVPNPRSRAWLTRLAEKQRRGEQVGRMHARYAATCRQRAHELVRDLRAKRVENVYVEKLPADIGQRGLPHVSSMRLISRVLRAKLGDRLREVDPSYTSQECSQCGNRAKPDWDPSRKVGICGACGHTEDRDINAARNILRKGSE